MRKIKKGQIPKMYRFAFKLGHFDAEYSGESAGGFKIELRLIDRELLEKPYTNLIFFKFRAKFRSPIL
jgi:hypothetical protein